MRTISQPSRIRKKVVMVHGSGRSGTTWLAEAINHDESYRYIFEPLRPGYTLPECPFEEVAPIPPPTEQIAYKKFFNKILAGRIENQWVNQFNTTRLTRKNLIKSVRSNLAIKWLHDTYPKAKIILLIRNPYAVVASRAQTDWGWEKQFQRTKVQGSLLALFNHRQQQALLSSSLSLEEQYFLSWCIENLAPLKLLGNTSRVKLAWYEELVLDPEVNFRSIISHTNDPYKSSMLAKLELPSRTSEQTQASHQAYLDGWKSQLSPNTKDRLRKCAMLFAVDRLYPDEAMPDKQAFSDLMRGADSAVVQT